jgi:hypothetical protein
MEAGTPSKGSRIRGSTGESPDHTLVSQVKKFMEADRDAIW